MPPRYAYWTILIGDEPTAFRAGSQEDLLPTLKRLQAKHGEARMMWFQNGKLWPSRIDAQEAMFARGEMGRRGDERQLARRSFSEGGAGFRSRDRDFKPKARFEKPEWKPRSEAEGPTRPRPQAPSPKSAEKLDWKPKGEFVPAPKRSERPDWERKSQAPSPKPRVDWKPKTQDSRLRTQDSRSTARSEKPEWKPKGSFDRERKPEWRPKTSRPQDLRTSRPQGRKSAESGKLEWKPKGEATSGSRFPDPGSREKRKWVPKAEYKKSMGIEAKKDKNWRPGGEHKDPRQKYKDAKKAKWTKFKTTIRTKWESKKKKTGE